MAPVVRRLALSTPLTTRASIPDALFTVNARAHASRQADALQGHGHELWDPFTGTTSGSGSLSVSLSTNPASGISINYASGSLREAGQGAPRIAKETRPSNVAFLPQIHA